MSAERTASPAGKTRVCPHCKSVILDSANICPACRHHLRFGPMAERHTARRYSAFHVEGTIRQTTELATCEYAVVIFYRGIW